MWLTIRKDWSMQCVCVLKSMCFSLFVFVLPVNWNGATWRRILCLQSPLHATIVHKPPPTPYVYLCSMLLMASTYVWTTLFHISCFSFCQLQCYVDIIFTSIFHQKLESKVHLYDTYFYQSPLRSTAGNLSTSWLQCLESHLAGWWLPLGDILLDTDMTMHASQNSLCLWLVPVVKNSLYTAHFLYMQLVYMPARRRGN